MEKMAVNSFGIVGAGIVGLATALRLRARYPEASIVLWEKEEGPGRHQSTHNSGVLHAGLYYKPGSLKARLAVEGIRAMTAYARSHNIPHEICGKLVVAVDQSEVDRLRNLYERGQQNGLSDLRWLDAAAIREREPHAAGVAAVQVPEEGIIDYEAVIRAMRSDLEQSGVRLLANSEVVRAFPTPGGDRWQVQTRSGTSTVDFLVNCAGLHSDRVAGAAGEKHDTKIIPFRGEYFRLKTHRQHLVRHLIYPVPDPQYPFLGVHFTRLIDGGIEAGPNAVLAFAREGYRMSSVNPRDLSETLRFPGLWRFLGKHRSMCWQEVRRSLSRKRFCASLQRLVPEIQEDDLEEGGAGVRAQAMSADGTLVQDFSLIERSNAVHVVNAPSPAATASLAIGDYIVERIEAQTSPTPARTAAATTASTSVS